MIGTKIGKDDALIGIINRSPSKHRRATTKKMIHSHNGTNNPHYSNNHHSNSNSNSIKRHSANGSLSDQDPFTNVTTTTNIPPPNSSPGADEYGTAMAANQRDYERSSSSRSHLSDESLQGQGQERRPPSAGYSDFSRGGHMHAPPPGYHPQQWPSNAPPPPGTQPQQQHYYYEDEQQHHHHPLSHSSAGSIPARPTPPPPAAHPPPGYHPHHQSHHSQFPPPPSPGYYYGAPAPPPHMAYQHGAPPPPAYEGYPPPPPHGAPPGYPPHSYYQGYPPPPTHYRLVPVPVYPGNNAPPPPQPQMMSNVSNKRKYSGELQMAPSKMASPMDALHPDEQQQQPPLKKQTTKKQQEQDGRITASASQEEDFLRHRMTDRDLLRHFYNYYQTRDMSLRAYTTQQHIGRSQFMRRWKELDVSTFKDQDMDFGDDQVLQERVGVFFANRQQRVVKHSTGGCKSFLTTDEEETFLAMMAEKAGNGEDDNGITKEMFLPTIKDIVEKDTPSELVDFVSNAIVESLWERKLSGIKKLSELKASKRLAARIKENRLQIGNIHTKQREIKVTREFLDKLYAYMEKKPDSYWTIVQSKEADGETGNRAPISPSHKMMDTSKEELFLMARLVFHEDVFKEIKAGKPWVDLLRLRVRTQVTEQGISLNKDMFNMKVKGLEQSIQAKETHLKMMKDSLSSS